MTDQALMAFGGGIIGLWLVVASWAIVRALTMQRKAAFAARRAGQLSAMLEASSALPLLVRSDGRLEGAGSIARWFALDQLPATIDGLSGEITGGGVDAIAPDALAQLRHAVTLAQRTAKPFDMVLRSHDGQRAIAVRGMPAPAALGAAGSALLWLSDVSDDVAKLSRLRHGREEAMAAFEAISALIEAAPFPMWFRDGHLQIALVNRAYVDAAEAGSAAEIVAQQIELVEPVAGLSARDAARSAHDSNETVARVVPVTIGGTRRMVQVVDIAISDVGVAGYALDRQELEDARSENRRFADARRSMLDQMSAGVAEFAPDRSLRFVNRPFLRLFMVDQEWASSLPAFERVIDRLRDNGRTPEVRDFPGWRATRRGWFAATAMIEESWLLRDGTHLRTVAQPTPDGGLLLIFEDQTEQIQLASARDTLLRVRTATFDNLFEAVAVFAPDGRLHLWNQRFRRLWEASEEYLVDHPRIDQLLDMLSPQLADPRQKSVLREMVIGATGERQQRGGRITFADDRQFDFAAIPLPDGNALFTLIDVTDSRRIERALRERAQALEAADRVKADFLSRISYELRTPLTSIGGFAEMLDSGYAGELPEAAKSYVKAILTSTEALGQQIDTVLDLSQSEAGAMPLERRAVNLAALVQEAVAAARSDAARAQVTIAPDIRVGVGQVAGDAKRLRQAIDQLIGHALASFADAQFQPVGGRRILVFADGDALSAQIVVSDNGPGVELGGTHAVGLALAKQLFRAHDGRFETVARKGEGAMVTAFLPR
ncbi:MAG: PAS-domain containing protein [Sphingopyxis sp.]